MISVTRGFLQIFVLISMTMRCFATTRLLALVKEAPIVMSYHNGALITGNITVNTIFYGKFKPTQRAIIADFISSLSSSSKSKLETVADRSSSTKSKTETVHDWWFITSSYYHKPSAFPNLRLGKQISDDSYSLGKSLNDGDLLRLALRGTRRNAINIVITSEDVAVDGFCMIRCGFHGSSGKGTSRFAYAWVGNAAIQCPGQCDWPFYAPIYGPQTTLVAPNGDLGLDGVVINLAGLLASTVTNPFRNGFFQGVVDAPVEAASACTGKFGRDAYPGNPGKVLVDSTTGGSYNAVGVNGRKFLLPALFDPSTSSCSVTN